MLTFVLFRISERKGKSCVPCLLFAKYIGLLKTPECVFVYPGPQKVNSETILIPMVTMTPYLKRWCVVDRSAICTSLSFLALDDLLWPFHR